MAKSLVLGNGNMLIGFDNFGQVFDLYFPYVGLENHLAGRFLHKMGVFVDGRLSWIDNGEWEITIKYATDTLASDITAVNHNQKITLHFTDVIYNEKDIFMREVAVTNDADHLREVKFYFNHQFEIYESHRGDTAYFDPSQHVIVHYKGRRVFVINAVCEGNSFDDYSIGLFGIEGKEGTFKDAEDGKLSQNPIEHGLVDSVIGVTMQLEPKAQKIINYWLTVSKYIKEGIDLNKQVLERTPEYLSTTAKDFWFAWANMQNFNFHGLDNSIIDLFKRSLLIVRSHVDNRGGVIASCDSDLLKYGRDTYSYVWQRDGAYSMIALIKAGYYNLADNFLDFCNEVITDSGYFMHKYRSDRSLGSSWHPWICDGKAQLPIQEDETAIIIYTLWQYYLESKDLEFVEGVYNSLIKKACRFMQDYYYPHLNLPQPSYDIWEEKYGINTYTAAAVYGAFEAAANFAQVLGKDNRMQEYRETARMIKSGILENLYNPQRDYFYKHINVNGEQIDTDPAIDMASIFGIVKFGVLDPFDEKVTKSIKVVEEKLALNKGIGGIPRYENDQYYRADNELSGNPWIITTLWLAQYYIQVAMSEQDLQKVKDLLAWVVKYSSPAGILSEQLHPYTGEPLSAAPLTWSHAEFITTVMEYMEKLNALGVSDVRAAKETSLS